MPREDVDLLRGRLEVSLRFTGLPLRNVSVREDAAGKTMKRADGQVREAGRADDALAVFLGRVEEAARRSAPLHGDEGCTRAKTFKLHR